MKKVYLFSVLFTAISLLSCSHKHDHGHGHDHDHDDMLMFTAYSDIFEVFAEATPLATNATSAVTAYVSHLSNFKPLESGKIVATLTTGSDKQEYIAESPIQEGVFSFEFTPKANGIAQLKFEIISNNESSIAIVENIKVFDDIHVAQHAAHDTHPESSNGITFNKSQSWKVGFATEVVKKSEFGQVIRTTAQVQPSSGDERIISSKTDGVVIFQNNQIVPGKQVGAGQKLFYIDASEMADNNLSVRLLEAENEYARAKEEFERKEELSKDNIVSQSELLMAKTELANAKANIDNLKHNFSEGRQSVSSPMSGFINDVLVKNGEYVSAGQSILRVSQNKSLFIKADLQPKYYNLLSNISTANIKTLSVDATYSLDELGGKVVSYGKSSDMSNPLIPVVFQVNNNINLIPGSFVEMYIRLKSDNQIITVPNSAIVEEMGAFFVMVQLNPEYFEKRAIEKGATDGFNTQIISGLSENERVVSKGAIFVKLAQDAGALDAHSGHVH